MFQRHPTKTATGTTSVTIAKGGTDRRTLIHRIVAIGASGPIVVADSNGTYWTEAAAGGTFITPLRQTSAGKDVTVTAPAATALSVQYAYEGA